MYKHVFSTGEGLLEEAAAVFGIHSKPGPGLKLSALNTEQWDRTEVVEIPHDGVFDAKYALVSTSGPGAAQVLQVIPSDGASGRLFHRNRISHHLY